MVSVNAYGICTILSLRTHGMVEEEFIIVPPYPDMAVVQVPIEDITDAEFVERWAPSGLWSTPLHYQDALRRWPERHAAAISAIAQADPGGVLFHCVGGNDRAGIIAPLLLALAGVMTDDILADYELSLDCDRDELLDREQSSVREVLLNTLSGLDIDTYLSLGGVRAADLLASRKRLLG